MRVCALESSREAALRFLPDEPDAHQAQLRAYKALPDDELFSVEEVRVDLSENELPGRPHRRVLCETCGEGVNDGREATVGGRVLCRACASGAYYKLTETARRKEARREP